MESLRIGSGYCCRFDFFFFQFLLVFGVFCLVVVVFFNFLFCSPGSSYWPAGTSVLAKPVFYWSVIWPSSHLHPLSSLDLEHGS